jgi:threonine dehydrogenase-like Zn-dependent dehydrogenase
VYSGICGTDLGIYGGRLSFVKSGGVKFPVRIGHEWAGVVESVGAEVAGFKPGDRVISDSGATCGVCADCLEGDGSHCANGRPLGTINAWDYGSFAEYILLPEWNMYRLDDDVSLEQGALIEPSTIALSGIDAIGVNGEDAVLVTGTGAVGLSAVALSKALGARKVIVAGRKQFKLDIGLSVGADVAINLAREDMAEAVMRETGGRGATKIVETSGSADLYDKAVDCARGGGTIALLGFYEDVAGRPFDLDRIVLRNLIVMGANGGRLAGRVMALMAEGRLDLAPLVTEIVPIGEAIGAFRAADERRLTNIKTLVRMTD